MTTYRGKNAKKKGKRLSFDNFTPDKDPYNGLCLLLSLLIVSFRMVNKVIK